MSSEILWTLALLAVFLVGLKGFMADAPAFFRMPPLRFLNRGGVPLYTRSFPLSGALQVPHIHRWQVEHWSPSSPILIPFAEQDGPQRVIMNEYFRLGRIRTNTPPLMRVVIRMSRDNDLVSVRGYANWRYVALTAYLLALLWPVLDSSATTAVTCLLMTAITYTLICGLMYAAQSARYNRLGLTIAEELPNHDERNPAA